MTLKIIPHTDLEVCGICFGTAEISTLDNPQQFLDAYLDMGGNFIDTALVYANWLPGEKSSSEKIIGRWLRVRNIPRDQIVLATKGAHPELSTMHISRVTPQAIVEDITDSLAHLQTDHIDLYWLHRDNPQHPVEPIIDALEAQVKAGKIRYYACSNWSHTRIKAARDYADSAGYTGFVANQPLWSMADVNPSAFTDPTLVLMNESLYSYHKESGLAAIPFSSQAKGYFTKLDTIGLEAMNPKLIQQYDNETTRQRFDRARQLAQQKGYTLNQMALTYLMVQPFTTIPIVGSKTLEQLKASMSTLEVKLSSAEVAFLIED